MRELKKFLLTGYLVILIFGCASAKPVEDRKMAVPDKKITVPSEPILSTEKIIIAPASVIHAFTSQSDEMDRCMMGRPEIWQAEIVRHLKKKFTEKGRDTQILAAISDEIKKHVDAVISVSQAGTMNEHQYLTAMPKLSSAYQGLIVIPRIIAKSADWTRGMFSVGKSATVTWDGVSRKPDTTGANWSRFLGLGSGGPPEQTGGALGVFRAITKVTRAVKEANEGGSIDVYSLHIDIFNASGLVFSGNGGFDTRQLVDSAAKLVKRENLCKELFDEGNKDNMVEAIQVALEPLFATYDGIAIGNKPVSDSPKKADVSNSEPRIKITAQKTGDAIEPWMDNNLFNTDTVNESNLAKQKVLKYTKKDDLSKPVVDGKSERNLLLQTDNKTLAVTITDTSNKINLMDKEKLLKRTSSVSPLTERVADKQPPQDDRQYLENNLEAMRLELQSLHGDNRNLKKIEVIFKNIKTLKDENEKIIYKTQIKADDLDRDMKDLIAQNQKLYSDNMKLRNISEIWASMIKLQKENAAILKEIDMTRTTHGTEQKQ